MKKILISSEYINLGQFLKLTGEIGFGGEAKNFLLTFTVYVNNVKENRRGRKLYPQDIIKINKNTYVIEGSNNGK